MGLLDRFRGGSLPAERTITVDRTLRRGQLMQLEGALLDLMDAMKAHRAFSTPGWQARHAEYLQVVQTIQEVRPTDFDWPAVSDIGYDIRPMLKGAVPDDQQAIARAQERVLALAKAIMEPLPAELS